MADVELSTLGSVIVTAAEGEGYSVNLGTFVVPASTTISAFGATLVDDADAATARTTLGIDSLVQQSFVIACSDETTSVSSGPSKVSFRMPYAFTLTDVKASAVTAPTGANFIIDINESGTTVLSTPITIEATETTSEDATAQPVISDGSLAADAVITIDFDQVGSTEAGTGIKVTLIGTPA